MPSCSVHTASVMPRDPLCGRRSTPLGTSVLIHVYGTILRSCLDLPDSNHVPWLIIGICYVASASLMLFIRFLLARENKRRDAEPHDETYDNVYLQIITEDGKSIQRRISKVRGPRAASSPALLTSDIVDSRSFWTSLIDKIATSVMYYKDYCTFDETTTFIRLSSVHQYVYYQPSTSWPGFQAVFEGSRTVRGK